MFPVSYINRTLCLNQSIINISLSESFSVRSTAQMLVFRTSVFVTLSVAVMLHNWALATEHTVGDRSGWDTTSNLQVWASSNIFLAGDSLSKSVEYNHSAKKTFYHNTTVYRFGSRVSHFYL